jgi:uncharacterized membrane protein YfcA
MVLRYLLLAGAALVAGAMNAVAGGGSFFTFPALVFAGVPPLSANASSSVALFPGTLASALAFRHDRKDFEGVSFGATLAVSIAGGIVGAILLLITPYRAFELIVPWLLLWATLAFIFGPRLAPMLRRSFHPRPGVLLGAQFLIAVYGGYFGGAVGLIMLAVWGLFGVRDIRMMNANRTLLGGIMNAAAVILFIAAGKIWWQETAVMLVGAVIGGYVVARMVRKLNPRYLRAAVTVIGIGVTIAFFLRKP